NTPDGEKVEEKTDFQIACEDMVHATRKFAKLDLRVHVDKNADATQWFFWLGQRFLTEKRVWEMFCEGFESDKMIKLYLEFRHCLFRNQTMKTND
ncbi:MAG: hypothetical protein ACRD4Y_13280, partial [Candidatus Acidiferrales bacterium]